MASYVKSETEDYPDLLNNAQGQNFIIFANPDENSYERRDVIFANPDEYNNNGGQTVMYNEGQNLMSNEGQTVMNTEGQNEMNTQVWMNWENAYFESPDSTVKAEPIPEIEDVEGALKAIENDTKSPLKAIENVDPKAKEFKDYCRQQNKIDTGVKVIRYRAEVEAAIKEIEKSETEICVITPELKYLLDTAYERCMLAAFSEPLEYNLENLPWDAIWQSRTRENEDMPSKAKWKDEDSHLLMDGREYQFRYQVEWPDFVRFVTGFHTNST